MRLFLDEPHYVLFTGEKDGNIYLFDPYYWDTPFEQTDIIVDNTHPFTYNRIVPAHYFNKEEDALYSLAATEGREAVILYNSNTKLTPDNTIEYFI